MPVYSGSFSSPLRLLDLEIYVVLCWRGFSNCFLVVSSALVGFTRRWKVRSVAENSSCVMVMAVAAQRPFWGSLFIYEALVQRHCAELMTSISLYIKKNKKIFISDSS